VIMAKKNNQNSTETDGSGFARAASSKKRKNGKIFQQWRQSLWVKLVMLASLLIITALLFPRTESAEYSYEVNEITNEAIIAPFTFPVLKSDEELDQDRQEARQEVPFVFERRPSTVDTQIAQINAFFDDLNELRTAYQNYQSTQSNMENASTAQAYQEAQQQAASDSSALATLNSRLQENYGINVMSEKWQVLLTAEPPDQSEDFVSYLRPILVRVLRDQFAQGIYDIPLNDIISNQVAIQYQGEEVLEEAGTHFDRNEAWINARRQIISTIGEENNELVNATFELVVQFLNPNLLYQREITERRQEEAIAKVPISQGIILENEKIVDANTRVTPEVKRRLSSLAAAEVRRGSEQGILSQVYSYGGRLLITSIILFLFVAFLITYRIEIYRDNKHLLLITLVYLLFIVLSYFMYYQWGLSEYIIPITIAAMLFTIIYDARVSFFGTITLAILIAFLLGNRMTFFITTIFACTLAILAVRRIRTRNTIYYAILYILGGYYLSLVATEFILIPDIAHLGENVLWASANGILSPLLTYGLIALIEMSFGITTDMTLLEMSDLNRPLLKQLAMRAPGTYHHSVVVGNLAEAAAEAVGANSLLARVGAYYHDIGKMAKPEYYIENQQAGENKHESLKPQLSALIVKSHVKEGLERAREHGLPQEITNFIPMHHGTMRMDYFYQKALQEAEETGVEVNESDFRYEGPKPNTKETGIVMLCEAIEAGTRSIQNPSPQKFHQFIDMIFDKRLKDGQLDECDLTIKELSKMRHAFVPILFGMYHLRIEYPDQQEADKEKQREWRRNLKATKP